MARGHKIRERIHVLDGRKAVGCRWILKGRQTIMVSVTIKKARLVVKMFSDKLRGVDYDETFSLVAMLKVCWDCISSLADNMSKHCFLEDFLEERLYVIQPEGFCQS